MKRINIFKKKFLLFFLLFFSIFSIFSTSSFSKRSASFFLDQEKVVKEEIDSEIWPLSNNLIILLFFIIIISIVYILCIIFPISKEEEFLFQRTSLMKGKRVSFFYSDEGFEELFDDTDTDNNKNTENLDNKKNNDNEVGNNENAEDTNNINPDNKKIFTNNPPVDPNDNKEGVNDEDNALRKSIRMLRKSLRQQKNREIKVETEEINKHKELAAKTFNFSKDDMKLIDVIIDDYYDDMGGGANLILEIKIQKGIDKQNIEELGGFKFSPQEHTLCADILGLKTIKKGQDGKVNFELELDVTQRLKNKYNFFIGIAFLARNGIDMCFEYIKDKKSLKNEKGFLDYNKALLGGFNMIIKRLCYVSAKDKDNKKKEARKEALAKYVEFFLMILYHFFRLKYYEKFGDNSDMPSFEPEKKKSFDICFPIFEKIKNNEVENYSIITNKKETSPEICLSKTVSKYAELLNKAEAPKKWEPHEN